MNNCTDRSDIHCGQSMRQVDNSFNEKLTLKKDISVFGCFKHLTRYPPLKKSNFKKLQKELFDCSKEIQLKRKKSNFKKEI